MSDRYETSHCHGWLDEGPPGWNAGRTVTREDTCLLSHEQLRVVAGLPGCSGEHELFGRSASGRMGAAKFAGLKRSIRKSGVRYSPMVEVGPDGTACVYEGNHRLRAALSVGIAAPVTFQYLGNSQRLELLVSPETGEINPARFVPRKR